MTDYGRGPGGEPWHPDDPLPGDGERHWPGGYDGADGTAGSWDPYGAPTPRPWPPQEPYPGQPYPPQAPLSPEQWPPHSAGPAAHAPYPQQGGWDSGAAYPQAPYDPQAPGAGAHPAPAPYDTGGYPDPYGAQAYPPQNAPHPPHGYPGPGEVYPGDAYPDPGAHHPDAAAAPHAAPAADPAPGPDPETGWDPGPDRGESDFFSRRDEDEEPEEHPRSGETSRRSRRGDRPKKRRAGCGCLVAAALVAGGVGGVAWYGYQFYQDRFGPAPDWAGEGSGEVQVEIPEGASLSDMGNLLRELGVVRSHDAFVEAAQSGGGEAIQPGVYTLRSQMSAESALTLLLDPSAANVLIIPEGRRATEIYALVDQALGEPEGTTEEVAANADLGLPDWAGGDVEGFLFPSRYSVGEDTTPEALLTEMVDRAEATFTDLDLAGRAGTIDRSPREVLVIASLIEAEAQQDEEFGRVSRVIHNRLAQDMRLEFDSTINYAMGRSTLETSIEDTQYASPYNTYVEFGLPPGPIDNPGEQAIEAALNPTDGDWLYFVTVREGDTRFTADYDEHLRNVEAFNEAQEAGE
ncbi:endolytic transglycosylase MltG [Streptomyces sp. DSM 44917]|uniref:Endolytic murein transglycosylase n=1 Tax=Streptomyces boetiae TaxID=3075541 RepID=A0ABU2LB29_9ACTN|nr:endolytic transglycosylase MltG [Streptomyces sp. DSM 44917]MDT0308779.1 endolytic transglycosylase MltG [Streptomyces sp. DSM 44917]